MVVINRLEEAIIVENNFSYKKEENSAEKLE